MMIARAVELAVEVRAPLVLPPGCDIAYLVDLAPAPLECVLKALTGRRPRLGLSLDYPDGLDPRHTGMAPADTDLRDALIWQLKAVADTAGRYGQTISTVACHGSLAQDVAEDERCTQVVARTLLRYLPTLSLAVPAGTRGVVVAHHCGIEVYREARVNQNLDFKHRCRGEVISPRVDRIRIEHVEAEK